MADDSKIIYGGPEPEFIAKVKSLGSFILEKLTENEGSDGLVCCVVLIMKQTKC